VSKAQKMKIVKTTICNNVVKSVYIKIIIGTRIRR